MSKNATYCNQLELSKLRDTTAEEERSADQGSRYSTLPEQSMAKLPPRRMWSARNEPEPIEETYEELNPAPGMQGFKSGGLDNDACYLSMKAAPPYPLFHQQQTAGHFHHQDHNVVMQKEVTPDRKNATTLVRVKKAILIFGICIAALLLVSAGALALGVVNLIKQPKAQVSSMQVGAVGSNKTLLSNGDVEALTLRVSTLEASLSQLQARLDQQLNDTSVAIAQLSSRVEARMDSINTQLITTSMAITNLSLRLNASVTSINTQLTATSADFANVNTRVNTFSTQLATTSAALTNLSSRVTAPVDIYSGCYKDTVACIVAQHSTNRYWYLCTTPFMRANVTNYYTLNMQCLRDPDVSYIDTTYMEISGSYFRCVCHVLGLTSSGFHNGTFNIAPAGDCHLVITRCPITQAIFTRQTPLQSGGFG